MTHFFRNQIFRILALGVAVFSSRNLLPAEARADAAPSIVQPQMMWCELHRGNDYENDIKKTREECAKRWIPVKKGDQPPKDFVVTKNVEEFRYLDSCRITEDTLCTLSCSSKRYSIDCSKNVDLGSGKSGSFGLAAADTACALSKCMNVRNGNEIPLAKAKAIRQDQKNTRYPKANISNCNEEIKSLAAQKSDFSVGCPPDDPFNSNIDKNIEQSIQVSKLGPQVAKTQVCEGNGNRCFLRQVGFNHQFACKRSRQGETSPRSETRFIAESHQLLACVPKPSAQGISDQSTATPPSAQRE